jgi:hypothetical protein
MQNFVYERGHEVKSSRPVNGLRAKPPGYRNRLPTTDYRLPTTDPILPPLSIASAHVTLINVEIVFQHDVLRDGVAVDRRRDEPYPLRRADGLFGQPATQLIQRQYVFDPPVERDYALTA